MEGYFLECPLVFFILVINIRNKRLMGNTLFGKKQFEEIASQQQDTIIRFIITSLNSGADT